MNFHTVICICRACVNWLMQELCLSKYHSPQTWFPASVANDFTFNANVTAGGTCPLICDEMKI